MDLNLGVTYDVRRAHELIANDSFIGVPFRITAEVQALAEIIGGTPLYIAVESEPGKLDDCFNIVAAKVEQVGGEMVLGWGIGEWPGQFIEGEHHAVWRSPAGRLVDITSRRDGAVRSLFVSDAKTPHRPGWRTPNVQHAISPKQEVRDLFAAAKEKNDLMGWDVGAVRLTGDDAKRMRHLEMRIMAIELRMRAATPRYHVERARKASLTRITA